MIQTFDFPIIIPLLPDPRNGLQRRMVDPDISISTKAKKITITWHIETTDLLGNVTTTTDVQYADNTTLVNLVNQQLLTMEEYEAMDPKPPVMGEFDFWKYANTNSPFPVMQQIADHGTLFAIRRGYLPPPQP